MGLFQEARHRRPRRGHDPHRRRGVHRLRRHLCAAGRTRVRAAAVCRLLRRHRHFARRGADVRHHHGRKLPPAVLLAHAHRVLAPLAYLAGRLAAQLPVLSAVDLEGVPQLGPPRQAAPRQSYRQGPADGRGLAHHVPRHRHLARRKLEVRRLRLLERHGHPRVHAAAAGVGQSRRRIAHRAQERVVSGVFHAAHVRGRAHRLLL